MPHIQRNGVNVYYESHGQGTPIVFLHPFSTNGNIWYFQTYTFAQEYQCVTIDHRGHGRSDKPEQGYAMGEMAADVAAVLDQLTDRQSRPGRQLDRGHDRHAVQPGFS